MLRSTTRCASVSQSSEAKTSLGAGRRGLLALAVATIAGACTRESSVRPGSLPAHSETIQRSMTYDLVLEDGQPLPASDSQPHLRVDQPWSQYTFVAGWYHLSPGRFESFDSVLMHRDGVPRDTNLSEERSGMVRHKGDTLFFEFFDSARGQVLPWDEGFVRGDTLYTGGSPHGGRVKVYVRRDAPPPVHGLPRD